MQLTDKIIKAAKPRDRRYELTDGRGDGLRLRVQPNGEKVFAVVYKSKSGKFVRTTLGAYGRLTLAEAREKASKARRDDLLNGGPILTFEAAVDKFLSLYSARRNRPSTIADNKRLLHKHFVPAWKGRDVRTISKRDVVRILDGIAKDAPSSADHALSSVRKLFYWLEVRGDIERCPASRTPKYSAKEPRDRVLSDVEIAAVWEASEKEGYPFGWAVQLLILTGQRPSEVVELPWAELTPTHWLLPAARAKNKIPNLIPLTDAVSSIIEKLKQRHSDLRIVTPFLFPNERDLGRPMLATTQKRERVRAAAGMKLGIPADEPKRVSWTLHDIRRTVRTGLARLRVPGDVAERLLNHVPNVVRRTYDVYSYEDEKREALIKWGSYVASLIEVPDEGRGSCAAEDRQGDARPLDSGRPFPPTRDVGPDFSTLSPERP